MTRAPLLVLISSTPQIALRIPSMRKTDWLKITSVLIRLCPHRCCLRKSSSSITHRLKHSKTKSGIWVKPSGRKALRCLLLKSIEIPLQAAVNAMAFVSLPIKNKRNRQNNKIGLRSLWPVLLKWEEEENKANVREIKVWSWPWTVTVSHKRTLHIIQTVTFFITEELRG